MTVEQENIQAAEEHVGTPSKLRQRFNQYLSVNDDLKPYFKNATLDFKAKRLVGTGALYLQWQIRKLPDHPTSYENQQTRCGSVVLKQFRLVTQTGGER